MYSVTLTLFLHDLYCDICDAPMTLGLRSAFNKKICLGLAALALAAPQSAFAQHSAVQLVSTTLGAQQPIVQAAQAPVLDLYDVWQLGLTNDPSYKAALSRYEASQTQETISRAGLLPQIQASFQKSRVHGWRERAGMFGAIQRSDLRYDSTNYYAQLSQPLLNYGRYAEYRRGQALARHGSAQFAVNQQRTSLQIAQSYFDTVLAFEDWSMQRSRVQFLAERVEGFRKMREFNNATEVELAETRARLAIAKASVLQAADQLRTSARQLQARIGQRPQNLRGISRDWRYQPLQQPLQELLLTAQTQSREIQAAKQEIAVYQARYDAAVSQYFPTLDLVATAGKADSEDLASLSQRSNTFAIGIQVMIPIFTGGYTTASKTQSRHQLNQAKHRYEATLDKVNTEVHKQHSLYSTGAQRVQAFKTATESAELSLDSALKSFSVGAASNLDVLDTQDELLDARYGYFKSRMELQLAQLQLFAALGEPLHQPVQRIADTQFQGSILSLPTGLSTWEDSADGWTFYHLSPSTDPQYPDLDQLLSRL